MKTLILVLLFSFNAQAQLKYDWQQPGKNFKFGSNAAGTKTLIFDLGLGMANPGVRANNSSGRMQYTNDGSTWVDFSAGGGSGGGGGGTTVTVTADTTMVANTVYMVNKPSAAANMTLPSSCLIGDTLQINGISSGGWLLKSNSSLMQTYWDDVSARAGTSGASSGLSMSTSGHSTLSLVCSAVNSDWTVVSKNGGLLQPNYFGTGSDGDQDYTTNTTLIVPNKTGPYDGEAVVMNYHNLTLEPNVLLTTDQPGRGMILYVSGDLHLGANAQISMYARGPNVDPSTVGATTLVVRRYKTGGSTTDVTTLNGLTGMGATAVVEEANQGAVVGGYVVSIPCVAGAGGAGAGGSVNGADSAGVTYNDDPNSLGSPGATVSGAPGGGGGGGAYNGGLGSSGAAGTCFAGGSGGGSSGRAGQSSSPGSPFAGRGGDSSFGQSSGGAGNPAGNIGATGNGGLLIIFVKGNVLMDSGSVITAEGTAAPFETYTGGGGSGGGVIVLLYAGTLTNNGMLKVNGGAGGGTGGGSGAGGKGGDGTIFLSQIDR